MTLQIDDPVLILSQLINNQEYYKKVLHHLEDTYFEGDLDRRIFKFIKKYAAAYSSAPTHLILKNALNSLNLNDTEDSQYIDEFVKLVANKEIVPLSPMIDKTEIYIKDMALKNAINEVISIYQGESNKKNEAIPDILKHALTVTLQDQNAMFFFDHDTAIERKKQYNNKENKIPFKIKKCNLVTDDGITKKSLQCFVAAPNVGKTAWLISLAADYIELGKNVLYVTCEMSQAQIGVRFDARFLNYETSEIPTLDDKLFISKIDTLREKNGVLAIKEYPTNELTAQKLEVLLDELSTLHDFKPDVVFVDYLGICSSYILKDRGNIGTYYTKVAEEFRACAQKKDFALWTAQQMTTDALDITDPTLKHIGYGQGIAKTADMVWFGIRTEELDNAGQMMIKQDKTRYHKQRIARFTIGFDIGYMKMHDVETSAMPIAESVKTPEEAKTKIGTAFNNIAKKVSKKIEV